VLATLVAAPTAAQRGQDGALVGSVTDPSGAALAGVTFTASSDQLIGGPQSIVSDAAGLFRFAVLPPGTYDIAAALAGFKTVRRRGVVIPPGLAITVEFKLPLASVPETIDVRADPVMLDVRSSASPAVIDRALLDNLPLDRNVSSYVNFAPGVVRDVGLGGSAFANPIALDGASGNEPGWGTPATPLTRSWVEEIQVVGPGADAQYGEFTGVALNAITRSGSNRFSAAGEYWATRHNWVATNAGSLSPALRAQFRPAEILERWEGTAQGGGPLDLDHLWFFGGTDRYRNDMRPAAFSRRPRTDGEPKSVSADWRTMAKLTGAVSSSARIEGYLVWNTTEGRGTNASPSVLPEALSNTDRGDGIGNVRLSWAAGPHTIVEARYGGNDRRALVGPPYERRDGPPPHADLATGVQSVNAQTFSDTRSRVMTGAAAVTYYRGYGGGLGHEFRVGGEYEQSRARGRSGYPGGRLYLDVDGQPDQVEFWGGATYRGRHSRTTAYAQDAWSLAPRVTVNAGIRFDTYRSDPPYPAHYATHSLAPRLGVAWDVAGNHKTLVRGHFGRYYDPMVSSFYDFLDPLSDTPDVIAQVVGPEEFRELYRFLPSTGFALDRHIRQSYVQESLVGVSRSLRGGLSLTAQYIHRDFKDTLSFVDTGTVWQPLELPDPGPDGRVGTSDDAGRVTVFNNTNPASAYRILTNPPQAFRRYSAVEFIASRHASSGRELQASYTWSRTIGNYNNAFSSNAANNDNSINGVFVNPNRALNSEGLSGFDATHVVRVLGTTTVPWGDWSVSGVYRYESGAPWSRLVVFFTGLNQGFEVVHVEPRVRATPATNAADVRIAKKLGKRGARTTVDLIADVFNVTNAGHARAFVEQSGPQFGLPAAWTAPCTLRAGVRVEF
jgi:hypothetical protein